MPPAVSFVRALAMTAVAALLLAASLTGAGQEPAAAPAAITTAGIEQAIQDLAHDDFTVRERATEYLIKAGEAAIPALQAASKSTDPEVVLRARIVLKRSASGLPPGMSPELASLVEEFTAADRNRKLNNFIYRVAQPAEIQVLTAAIGKERNAADRQSLDSSLRARVAALAGQHYREGRTDDAVAVLAAREGDSAADATLLSLEQMTGRLAARAEQLTVALATKPDPAMQRKLALVHRATGDLPKAREAADKLATKDLALWLAIEAADWPAALAANLARYSSREPTTEELAFTLVLSHYAADQMSFAAAKRDMIQRAGDRPAEVWPAAEALLAVEQFDDAIELLKQGVPAAAFYLLWYRHDFEAAFALANAGPGATFDAAWYAALPDGNTVPTSLSLRRTDYAGDVASVLHYVGRKDEARQVLDLVREAVRKESPTSLAWYDLVEADLRMGLREQALDDAVVPLSRPATTPATPLELATGQVQGTSILAELYGRDFPLRSMYLWLAALAASDGDARQALGLVEPLLHLPTAGKLAPTECRARFDALLSTPADPDRYRHSRFLAQTADLAARLGEEDLAFRLRARGMNMARSGSTFLSLQRGMDAVSDRDWASAIQYLRRYQRASSGTSQQQEHIGVALLKLGQEQEARDNLELALKWQINPSARALQAQFLLSYDLKAAAAERYRVAARLMPPGEGITINALNSLGNSLNTTSPGEAATLWKINMLGPLMGSQDMTLDMYLKNTAVIRRELARAALQAGRYREAADHALAELAAMPGDVVGVEQLVPLFDEQGQQALGDEVFARSVASYARVSQKFPQSAAHRNLLARTSARSKRRLDEAFTLAKEAIALDASNANYYSTLAEVHLARGERPAAIAAAEAGLALEPKHAVCERVLSKARE